MKKNKLIDMMGKFYREKPWNRAVTTIAAVIVFITTYLLILPAITMTVPPTCGKEEHTHTAECYSPVYIRTMACPYAASTQTIVHKHDENCYQDGVLVCPLKEVEAHTHTAECYGLPADTVLETLDGTVLEAGQPVQAMAMPAENTVAAAPADPSLLADPALVGEGEAVVEEEPLPPCGKKQVIVHTHNESCYDELHQLICQLPEVIEHQHTDECFLKTVTGQELTCGLEEHIHTDDCYQKVEAPAVEEGIPEAVDAGYVEENADPGVAPLPEEIADPGAAPLPDDNAGQGVSFFILPENTELATEPGAPVIAEIMEQETAAPDSAQIIEDGSDALVQEAGVNQSEESAENTDTTPVLDEASDADGQAPVEAAGTEGQLPVEAAGTDGQIPADTAGTEGQVPAEQIQDTAAGTEGEVPVLNEEVEEPADGNTPEEIPADGNATGEAAPAEEVPSIIEEAPGAENQDILIEEETESTSEADQAPITEAAAQDNPEPQEDSAAGQDQAAAPATEAVQILEAQPDTDAAGEPAEAEAQQPVLIEEAVAEMTTEEVKDQAAEEVQEQAAGEGAEEAVQMTTEKAAVAVTEEAPEAVTAEVLEKTTEKNAEPATEAAAQKVTEADTEITTAFAAESGTALTTEPNAEPGTGKTTEAMAEPGTEKTTEFMAEPGTEKTTEFMAEPGTEKTTEFMVEPGTEQTTEFIAEPGTEQTTEFIAEPGTEQTTEFITETGTETTTEFAAETGTEFTTAFTTELYTETTTEFVTETETEGTTEQMTETASETTTAVLEYKGKDYKVRLTYTPSSGLPEGASVVAEEILPGDEEGLYDQYLAEAKKALGLSEDMKLPEKYARFFDIQILNAEGVEIEPTGPVRVEIIYDEPVEVSGSETPSPSVLHFDDESKEAQVISSAGAGEDEAEAGGSDEQNSAGEESEAEAETDTETDPDKEADSADPAESSADPAESAEDADKNTETADAAGDPAASAEGSGTPENSEIVYDSLEVTHVDQGESANATDSLISYSEENSGEAETTAASFTTDGFSVYGVVYTVDFHYEVNGKVYEFSIPGGGFVSLEHVVEVLGISTQYASETSAPVSEGNGEDLQDKDVNYLWNEQDANASAFNEGQSQEEVFSDFRGKTDDEQNASLEAVDINNITVSDATKRFVAEVAEVEFSNPDLIWVGRVEADTTVGQLKEGLTVQYSADLTERQISEINAQTVEAGDWVLFSLIPFVSEETIDITLKNGDQFTINVTDAQIGTIEDGGKYLIYFPYENEYYYVIKGDGTTERISVGSNPNRVLNKLGDEYLWTFDYTEFRNVVYWLVHSNSGRYLQLDETRHSNGSITSYNPTGIRFVPAGWSGNSFFNVSEYSSNNNGGYEWYYLGFEDGNAIVRNGWENYNVGGEDPVFLFKQEDRTYSFTVKTEYDNIYRGTVTGKDQDNIQRNNIASFVGETNPGSQNFTNKEDISANAYTGYLFDHWRLGDRILTEEDFLEPPELSPDGKTSKIKAGKLVFPEDNMVLTAVFKKDSTSSGVADYSGLIHDYMKSLKKDPLVMDKTAEVYDYDNRIYEVDIMASGDAQIITPDIELAFVTDVSRSMYFPSYLDTATTFTTSTNNPYYSQDNDSNSLIKKLDYLHQNYYAQTNSSDHDEVYYIIGNPGTDATVYAIRKNGNDWYYIDASYDITTHPKKGVVKRNEWDYYAESDLTSNGGKYNHNTAPNRWYKLKDNLEIRNGNLHLIQHNKTLTDANLYVAKDDIYRLDYLQQAVDIASDTLYSQNQEARIGLVTFAKWPSSTSLYGKNQYHSLINDLNSISPAGNTNQRAGLEEAAKTYWQDDSGNIVTDTGKQRVVILITDGAPNVGSTPRPNDDSNWTTINDTNGIATVLKNDYGATLYTIGISVDAVDGAKNGLTNTASEIPIDKRSIDPEHPIGTNNKYAFFTSDGPGLVESILQIVQSMFTQIDLYGTISDTVDSAFYPVNADGTPVQVGFYKADGTPLDPSLTTSYDANHTEYFEWVRNGENWIINWYNVKFKRGTKDNDGNVITYGMRRNMLIKAKEDFLGGNTISTNQGKAWILANYYKEIVKDGETPVIKGALTPPILRDKETPYVNVDELAMNTHENSWTVYLGTNVDPMTQLKEMFDDIKIREVVTLSQQQAHQEGIISANSQVMQYDANSPNDPTKSGSTIYTLESGAFQDDDATLKNVIPSTFSLTDVLKTINGLITTQQWNSYVPTLWQDLVAGNTVSLKYYGDPAYGHGTSDVPVGIIEISLTKIIADGEGSIPDAHDTSVTNEENNNKPVEKYSLTVTYTPTGPTRSYDEYHTGTFVNVEKQPGIETNQMISTNIHDINVFTKKLQIEKKDKKTGQTIKSSPATFTLYKSENSTPPAKATDIISVDGTVMDGYTAVATLTTNTTGTDAGKTNPYVVKPLKYGMFLNDQDKISTYYLIETVQPDGYIKSTTVWPVILTLHESPTNSEGASIVSSNLPYNWIQSAVLKVGDQVTANNSDTVSISLIVDNEKVDIEILKVDETGKALDLATFRLQKKEGTYQDIKTIKKSPDSEELKYSDVTGVDENSSFTTGTTKTTITNLADGEYKLIEDNTKAGYIIRQKEINFAIINGVIRGTDIEGIVKFEIPDSTKLALVTVTNEPGAALPATGGSGTVCFYLAGILMTVFACFGIFLRRKQAEI